MSTATAELLKEMDAPTASIPAAVVVAPAALSAAQVLFAYLCGLSFGTITAAIVAVVVM